MSYSKRRKKGYVGCPKDLKVTGPVFDGVSVGQPK